MKCSDCKIDVRNKVSYLLADNTLLCACCFNNYRETKRAAGAKRYGKFNRISKIDIFGGDLDVYVHGQKVLHIGQTPDINYINMWLYTAADIMLPVSDDPECKMELLISREEVK